MGNRTSSRKISSFIPINNRQPHQNVHIHENPLKSVEQQNKWILSERDIAFLVSQTGLSPDEIRTWHERFFDNNPDGRLDREEFRKLFHLLRQEPPERLDNICDHVFRAFDIDSNGYVEFGEFLLGFAICSRGNLRSRLDYAFECYDVDSNGYITEDEIQPVLRGMYTLLGIQHVEDYPPETVAKDLMKKLDISKDGRVSKDEFIDFLMKEGIYRNTVNPFH